MTRKYPLHVHIITMFLLLILPLGAVVTATSFKLSRDMLQSVASDMIRRIGAETGADIAALVAPAELAVNMMAHTGLGKATSFAERRHYLPQLREALLGSSALSSIYIGYPDGDFFFFRRIIDEAQRVRLKAPGGARYVVQAIDHDKGHHIGRYIYLDDNLGELGHDERLDYARSYDPRTREWFKAAQISATGIKTAPYLFFSDRKVGMTLAARSGTDSGSVVGADILLETLGNDLKEKKLTPGTHLALVNEQGLVLAHDDVASLTSVPDGADGRPRLTPLADFEHAALRAAVPLIGAEQHSAVLTVGDADWQVDVTPVQLQGMPPLSLVIAIPEHELLAAAFGLRSTALLITLASILLSIVLAWVLARALSKPLRALHAQAEKTRRFDFSDIDGVGSMIKEVDDLSQGMGLMRKSVQRFIDISQAVGGEMNFNRLMPTLLRETLAAAEAEIGILYLADQDGLIPMVLLDAGGEDIPLPLLPVPLSAAGPLLASALAEGKTLGGTIGHDDIEATGLDAVMDLGDVRHGVAVPLRNRQQQLVGAMLLVRRTPVDDAQLSFIGNLAVSAASSLEARELIKAQKELFEAFIKLIAGAIDAKSPYTGGHCERVPELTKMLARAACTADDGPFKDFQLDEHEWEAVHIAAWLHDCGKVTTPEFVVDKATKLETLHDRIHEIRMRFEVLKRDAEIDYWQGMAAGGEKSALAARRDAALAQLDDDFAFVAACNEGGESMSPEQVSRLEAIATRTWQRTLDDRIGISHEEHQRKSLAPAPALPVAEPLLADRPEHVFARRPQDRIGTDNPWGFRMQVPEALYNKGELYNLTVGRGTLTAEERYKINEHIVQTVIMLSALPFPKHLRNVPEIASGHHEKMDGTGYPRRLSREEMSPLARMLAIADIFEALTAVDRPYKKGKLLSEAVWIMALMARDRHIDPELFELFLRAGVHREYADRFMRPEQIDAVDIDRYLTPA